jgi:hypothetical protein
MRPQLIIHLRIIGIVAERKDQKPGLEISTFYRTGFVWWDGFDLDIFTFDDQRILSRLDWIGDNLKSLVPTCVVFPSALGVDGRSCSAAH